MNTDLPTRQEMRTAREAARADGMKRRETAELLGLHQDSVSRLLPDGLAAAVVEWGGRGKEMLFARVLVSRWRDARACQAQGRRCPPCDLVLFSAKADAEHQVEHRHGYSGCADCWVPYPPSAAPWSVVRPCSAWAGGGHA